MPPPCPSGTLAPPEEGGASFDDEAAPEPEEENGSENVGWGRSIVGGRPVAELLALAVALFIG
jgi:hypothetical protein